MLPKALKGIVAALAMAGVLAVPSSAQAFTHHWASYNWLGPGSALRDPFVWVLAGAYCHELDGANTRKIQINATWNTGVLYGSWVDFWTEGLRTYAGNNALAGACRNPHSVGYSFNAHDNYYI